MMGNYRTREQQIEHLRKLEEALKEKREKLMKTDREIKEKKRTHRLIEVGATVESVLGKPIEKADLPQLKQFLLDQELRGNYFSKAMAMTKNTEPIVRMDGRTDEPPFN